MLTPWGRLGATLRGSQLSVLSDRRLRVFLLILFVNGAISGPLNSFLSIYVAEGLDANQSLTGNLRTVSLIFMAIFALVGGAVSDSLGPRATFFLGVSGTPAAALVFLVDSHWLLFVLAAYEGMGLGMLSTGSQSYLLNATWMARVGAATGLYFAFRTLGGALGDPIAGAVLQSNSFGTLGLFSLVASVPLLAATVIFLPPVASRPGYRPSIRSVLRGYVQILQRGQVLALALVQFLRTTFWGAAGLALPFLIKSLTGSTLAVGWFGFASLTSGVAAVLVFGPISDRVGRKKVVLSAILAMVAGAALLATGSGSTLGLFLGGVIASIGAWTLSGQVPPLVKEVERGGEAGRVMAMATFPWAVGTLTGAQLHGRLTESSPQLLFAITAGLLALAFASAIYLFARRGRAALASEIAGPG